MRAMGYPGSRPAVWVPSARDPGAAWTTACRPASLRSNERTPTAFHTPPEGRCRFPPPALPSSWVAAVGTGCHTRLLGRGNESGGARRSRRSARARLRHRRTLPYGRLQHRERPRSAPSQFETTRLRKGCRPLGRHGRRRRSNGGWDPEPECRFLLILVRPIHGGLDLL